MKKVEIWLCEDDTVHRRQLKEILEGDNPGWRVTLFGDVRDALLAAGSPDFIIMDVGSISPLDVMNSAGYRRGILCAIALLVKHCTANVYIYSCLESWATDLIRELKAGVGDVAIEQGNEWVASMTYFVKRGLGLEEVKK